MTGRRWAAGLLCLVALVSACSGGEPTGAGPDTSADAVDGSADAEGSGETEADSDKLGLGRTVPPDGVFVDVAVTRWASCGVRGTGELECWGQMRFGPPEGRYSMLSASSDGRRLCAVERDGDAVCWAPHGAWRDWAGGGFAQVSADAECGVTVDGGLECWGEGVTAFEELPGGRFVEVVGVKTRDRGLTAVGPVCALDAGGALACWGDLVNFDRSRIPEGRFTAVAANGIEACALGAGGDVECWQLWGSVYGERGVSSRLAGGVAGDFVELGADNGRWCALAATGEMVCWGYDGPAEVGMRPGPFTQIRVDGPNNCGLRASGQVSCWGYSSQMLRRDEAGTRRWDSPEGVFTDFDVSGGIACGVREDTTLECWGYEKALDDDGNGTAVRGADGWVDLRPREAGFERVWLEWPSLCALRTDGVVGCWADIGGNDGEQEPLELELVGEPRSVRLIRRHAPDSNSVIVVGYCVLRADGTPYCTDPATAASLPQGRFADISLDARCGVRLDGRIECWGYRDNYTSPPGTGPFTDVTLGGRTACGIEFDSEVVCWDLATLDLVDAEEVGVPFVGAAARFADGRRGCAIDTNGLLIGDCSTPDGAYLGPVEQSQPPSGAVIDVAFNYWHACAVLVDGAVTCWGADFEWREEPPVLCYEVSDC